MSNVIISSNTRRLHKPLFLLDKLYTWFWRRECLALCQQQVETRGTAKVFPFIKSKRIASVFFWKLSKPLKYEKLGTEKQHKNNNHMPKNFK